MIRLLLLCILTMQYSLHGQNNIIRYLTFPAYANSNQVPSLLYSLWDKNQDTTFLLITLAGNPHDTVEITFLVDGDKYTRKLNNKGFDTFKLNYNLYYKLQTHLLPYPKISIPLPKSFADTLKTPARIKVISKHEVIISMALGGNKRKISWQADKIYYDVLAGRNIQLHFESFYATSGSNHWPAILLKTAFSSNKNLKGLTYTTSTPWSPINPNAEVIPGNGFLAATAQQDSTLVEFTPNADLLGGYKKGQTYRKWLQAGQSLWIGGQHGQFSYLPNNSDISGTKFRVVNCKPIEILNGSYWGMREFVWKGRKNFSEKPYIESGNGKTMVELTTCRSVYSWQLPPDQALGRRYLVPVGYGPELFSRKYDPTLGDVVAGPYFHVVQAVALFDNTRVRINGRSLVLSKKGDTGGDTLRACGYIESDKPVAISYYVDAIRGGNGQGFPAFCLDDISTDTLRLNVGWNSKDFVYPGKNAYSGGGYFGRPYANNAIAWIMAKGEEGKGAEVWVNGQKLTLKNRVTRVPEPFFFDTAVLKMNDANWVWSPKGAYVLYASEFMTSGVQQVGIAGLNYDPRWLKMKVGGKWLSNAEGVQAFCAETPQLLEAVADWYKPEAVVWSIDGKRDTGMTLNYSFADTGLHSIELYTLRPDDECASKVWDTLSRAIRIYSIPKITLPQDTVICKGTQLVFKARVSEAYLPVWTLNDTSECRFCDSFTSAGLQAGKLLALVQKPGCKVVGDSLYIKLYDTLLLNLTAPDTALCFGQQFHLKAQLKGSPRIDSLLWSVGIAGRDSISLTALKTGYHAVKARDYCTGTWSADSALVEVFAPLKLSNVSDTSLCEGDSLLIAPTVIGGKPLATINTYVNNLPAPQWFIAGKDSVLQITTNDGCSLADTLLLNIKVKRKPTLSIAGLPNKWCRGQAQKLLLTATGGDTTNGSWKVNAFGKSEELLAGTRQQFTFKPESNALLKLSYVNSCFVQDTFIQPTIAPAPTATWKLSSTSCFNADTLRATWSAVSAGIKIYDAGGWQDSFSTGANMQKVLAPARSPLWVVADDGCSLLDTQKLTRNIAAPLRLISPETQRICQPQNLRLAFSSAAGLGKRNWQLTGENGITATDSVISYAPLANHWVKASVQDQCGIMTDSVRIWVGPQAKNRLNDTSACNPLGYNKEVIWPNATNWQWRINGKTALSGFGSKAQLNNIFNEPGSFMAEIGSMADTLFCKANPINITVWPNPTADFDFTPQIVDVATPEVTFFSTSTGATRYLWQIDGINKSITEKFKTKFADTGQYRIWLRVTSNQGCADSTLRILRVHGVLMVYAPNAIGQEEANRLFKPAIYNGKLEKMQIFSRWGEMLYEGIEAFNPEKFPGSEVFVYRIYAIDHLGRRQVTSGNFTVLR